MNNAKLRHVVAVDRFGSITRAAQNLNVTQSAVTKSVAEVERELGYPLFERLARGVFTTVAGRLFIDRAHRILSDLDQLVEDSRTEGRARDTLLRVVVCPASIEGLLNRAVRHFVHAMPNCRIHLRTSVIEDGVRLLRQGDADICIGEADRLMSMPDFETVELPPMRASLFGRRDHPLASKAKLLKSDLVPFPIILPDQSAYMEKLPNGASTTDQRSRGVHILEHFNLVADIVATTDALGIVANGYASSGSFSKRFVTLPYDVGRAMPLALATRARWPESRPITLFKSTLAKYPLTGSDPAPRA